MTCNVFGDLPHRRNRRPLQAACAIGVGDQETGRGVREPRASLRERGVHPRGRQSQQQHMPLIRPVVGWRDQRIALAPGVQTVPFGPSWRLGHRASAQRIRVVRNSIFHPLAPMQQTQAKQEQHRDRQKHRPPIHNAGCRFGVAATASSLSMQQNLD